MKRIPITYRIPGNAHARAHTHWQQAACYIMPFLLCFISPWCNLTHYWRFTTVSPTPTFRSKKPQVHWATDKVLGAIRCHLQLPWCIRKYLTKLCTRYPHTACIFVIFFLSANGPSIACSANMCWKAEHHSTDTCWISQMGSSNSSIIFYYNWVLPQQERRPFEPGSQAIWACQAMQCTFIVQSHVWHTCILLRRLCWPLGSLLRPDLVMLVQGYLGYGYLRNYTILY